MVDRREFRVGMTAALAVGASAAEAARVRPVTCSGRYDVYLRLAEEVPAAERIAFSQDVRVTITHAQGTCGYSFDLTRAWRGRCGLCRG